MKLLRTVFEFAFALARELSDQNAYDRYLAWHSVEHSPEQWRRFMDGKLRRKYQQGKCC